jgi:hypothetical protein
MRRSNQGLYPKISRSPGRRTLMDLVVGAALAPVAGCATTQQVQPNILAKAQGAQNPVPQFSGFLGDYSLLQPGARGKRCTGISIHLQLGSVQRSHDRSGDFLGCTGQLDL